MVNEDVCGAEEPKKGKKVDPLKPLVADPNSIPVKSGDGFQQPGTAWRPDKYRDMTYTQFWHLVQQKQIDKVCPGCPPPPGCVSIQTGPLHRAVTWLSDGPGRVGEETLKQTVPSNFGFIF